MNIHHTRTHTQSSGGIYTQIKGETNSFRGNMFFKFSRGNRYKKSRSGEKGRYNIYRKKKGGILKRKKRDKSIRWRGGGVYSLGLNVFLGLGFNFRPQTRSIYTIDK